MEKVYQGELSDTGETEIICTTTSLTVVQIVVNNPNTDYLIILTKVDDQQTPIYRFELDMGDTLRDTHKYILFKGERLQLVTNVPGTTYSINALEN
jgi:hypothetical protein